MNQTLLLIEDFDAVRRISLNRPAARNAQSQQLLDELDAALAAAASEPKVRAIVLAGVGDHFSAGHDLKEAQQSRAGFTVEERWDYESLRYYDYCLRLWDLPKPTIAAVQGACISGGFMIANMCDLIICADDARFSDPVGRTLAAAATEVLIHPWVMGLRKAKEFLFAGGSLDAAEALRIGMVNAVVPRDSLPSAALALAERVAQTPPFAARLMKKSLNRSLDAQGFRLALAAHFDTHQLSHVSEEFRAMRDRGLASAIERGKAQ